MNSSEARRNLRVLIVEDNVDDAELLELELRRSRFSTQMVRVESLAELRRQLEHDSWEVVISDFGMVSFTALDALRVVQESGRDLPFIIVSGSVGEQTAVDAMKSGAHDFFLKDNLTRLGSVIERELREAENRRQRREAIERVAENERRLSAMFNQTIVGIAQTDLQRRLIEVNDRFCRMTGRSREQLIGSRIVDVMHPDDRPDDVARFAQALGERGSYTTERRYVSPDGGIVWVNSSVSVVVDPQGDPGLVVAMVEDISDRKRAEAELKLAVNVRDEFMAMASHELKTPMTALELGIANCERLAESLPDRSPAVEKLRGRLGIASQLVDRLTSLVNNLLDVTRITAGRLRLDRQVVDLRYIVQQSVEQLRDVVERSGSTIEIADGHPVVGSVDTKALESVVVNLVTNAAKYGRGKPIEIAVGRTDGHARIEIRDHGMGIAEEDLPRIFERFERAVPSRHYGGLGIGLWIARNVVEAHGGRIEVSSRPDHGSTFVIELPLASAAAT